MTIMEAAPERDMKERMLDDMYSPWSTYQVSDRSGSTTVYEHSVMALGQPAHFIQIWARPSHEVQELRVVPHAKAIDPEKAFASYAVENGRVSVQKAFTRFYGREMTARAKDILMTAYGAHMVLLKDSVPAATREGIDALIGGMEEEIE